jgi:hypothetical protein
MCRDRTAYSGTYNRGSNQSTYLDACAHVGTYLNTCAYDCGSDPSAYDCGSDPSAYDCGSDV